MRRAEVVNSVLSLFREPDYLEIGVCSGDTFFEVQANSKTAVDPKFQFDARSRGAEGLFLETTSDLFFCNMNIGKKYDVIYLDGLHTFSQITRDLINSICCLKDCGVIVIDDVLPNSYHASLPDMDLASKVREKYQPGSTDYSWMGDVYKVVYFIRNFVPLFSYATVADNHGQIVMWRFPRNVESPASFEQVAATTFESIMQQEDKFNLMPMASILKKLELRF